MILDTCQWGEFLKQKPDMQPIHKWLKKWGGKIVTSKHEDIAKEAEPMRQWLVERERGGQAEIVQWIEPERVEKACNRLKAELGQKRYKLESNDLPVLAMAQAGGVKLLCTKDQALELDFKEIIKGGRIYKRTKQARKLLTQNTCPSS